MYMYLFINTRTFYILPSSTFYLCVYRVCTQTWCGVWYTADTYITWHTLHDIHVPSIGSTSSSQPCQLVSFHHHHHHPSSSAPANCALVYMYCKQNELAIPSKEPAVICAGKWLPSITLDAAMKLDLWNGKKNSLIFVE